MPFEKLEGIIENYLNECVDKDNNVISSDKCNKMFHYLQQNILPKSRNTNINVNKK